MIDAKGKHKLNIIIFMFQKQINGREYIKKTNLLHFYL